MKLIRVGCYVRVSHEEQAKHGYSIDNQKQTLEEFARSKGYKIIGYYCDEGVSADKLNKRTELKRLLDDVKAGNIDMIIFTKLDRWFRSVAKYYQIQSILDKHNVTWQCSNEDYETITANGKFKVNIMLSVAQQERDRTGERIVDVFGYMVQQKKPISGSVPLGFKIEDTSEGKRIVHDPDTEAMVKDMINYYMMHQNRQQTLRYLLDKYGFEYNQASLLRLLKNTLIKGEYRGIKDFCEPYITEKEFDDLQFILSKSVRYRKSNVYLFTKMIKCPHCSANMVGQSTTVRGQSKTYKIYSYRCEKHYRNTKVIKQCDFSKSKDEKYIENQLLDNLNSYMKDYVLKYEVKDNKPKKINEAKIKSEMDRLTDVFIMGRISKEDYDRRYSELNAKLTYKPISRDLSHVKDMLKTNILDLYNTLEKAEKRLFWQSLIKSISIDDNFNITSVEFF